MEIDAWCFFPSSSFGGLPMAVGRVEKSAFWRERERERESPFIPSAYNRVERSRKFKSGLVHPS